MNILIIGASSSIGQSIAKRFSENNNLFLLSTKKEKLNELQNKIQSLGCSTVKLIEADLSKEIRPETLIKDNIDIFINAACSTSKLRNQFIDPKDYRQINMVDLSNPLNILQHLIEKKIISGDNSKLYFIFINTILSKIQSHGHSIYLSYKILQQEYINGFERQYGDILKSINVIVGTQIDRTKETQKTIKLAERIKLAINNNETEFIFGLEGKIIYFLYRISPLLSDGLIYMKRYLFNNK